MNKKFFAVALLGAAVALTSCGGNAEDAKVLKLNEHNEYLVTGQQFGWGYNEKGIMTAASKNDVKALKGLAGGEGEAIYNILKDRDVKGLYIFKDLEVGTQNVWAGWTATAKVNGEFKTLDGSFAYKPIGCDYIEEDQTWTTTWLIDRGVFCEALNDQIDLSYPHSEEKDEGGRDWVANPVIVNGAGKYTVVYAEYAKMSGASGDNHGGFGVIKTEALEEGHNLEN